MSDSTVQIARIAQSLACSYTEAPCLIAAGDLAAPIANRWRLALRQAGVPVLEINGGAASGCAEWLGAATAFSAEYLSPVVVLGADLAAGNGDVFQGSLANPGVLAQGIGREVTEPAWRMARQVALTRAVETSLLNQEFRRTRAKQGWVRFGWQPESVLAEGNGLQLAWSSPLPLLRLRNFAARCPEVTLWAADAPAMADEVAAQGISVSGWRFAVK